MNTFFNFIFRKLLTFEGQPGPNQVLRTTAFVFVLAISALWIWFRYAS